MWGGYACSRNFLIVLNIVYVMIAFLLIGVATYGQTSSQIASLPILGGIVASGIFLLLISAIGLFATVRQHQVLLFVYMLVLFFIFIIQFSVACAALSVSKDRELQIAQAAWNHSSNNTKFDVENYFGCCGFGDESEGITCEKVPECNGGENLKSTLPCPVCKEIIEGKIGSAFKASGGLGLFFALTEFVAVVFAYRCRRLLRDQSGV